jgi:hypothetical protein
VDKVSSAHVYLRLKKGETIHTISEALLEDCAQLVKAHSIQGACSISSDLSLSLCLSPWEKNQKQNTVCPALQGFSAPTLQHVAAAGIFSHSPPVAIEQEIYQESASFVSLSFS